MIGDLIGYALIGLGLCCIAVSAYLIGWIVAAAFVAWLAA